jgi:hypothetical protein
LIVQLQWFLEILELIKFIKTKRERDADIANPNTETTAEHIAQDIKVEVSPKGLNVLQKVMNQNNDKPKS